MSSCSSLQMIEPLGDREIQHEQNKKVKKSHTKENEIIVIQDIDISPGKVKYIKFNLISNLKEAKLYCDKDVFPFLIKEGRGEMFFRESYFSTKHHYFCYLKNGTKKVRILAVNVKPFKYKQGYLRVNPKRVFLAKKDSQRVAKEQVVLNKIYKSGKKYAYFDSHFIRPLNSKITSWYGTKRIFNGKKKSQHLGTDFRAAVGFPIPVTNKGKVVFSGDLFYTGNTVIVDHGMGIFSVYGHLSKLKVHDGEYIPRSTIIGLAGATGRASGPHLHWGIKIFGQYIDGLELVKVSKNSF